MVKINVGHNKCSVGLEKARDLGEFLVLETAHVLKHSLSQDDVEPPIFEADGVLYEVHLHQIWLRIVQSDVDPVVVYICVEQMHKRRRTATDVEQIALFPLRKSIQQPCRFL